LFPTSDKVITDATSSSSSAAALSAVATSSSNSYDATSMELIDQELRRALRKAYPSDDNIHSSSTNMMLFQGKSEFGDYQCNIAMPLSKVLKQKPRDIAETIMSNVAVDADGARSIIEKMDISGPGFININLSSYYIKQSLYRMLQPIELLNTHDVSSSPSSSSSSSSRTDEEVMTKVKHQSYMYSSRVGVPLVTRPQRIVVDFSSPNIAKEMHVVRGMDGWMDDIEISWDGI
jgi:arginyl-tRNA synthetase